MRTEEPRKQLSDLPPNRATIRVMRHDQTERVAAHEICEYLACSTIMNVLVVECSGGNSRPSCPSGVGGGTLGNLKIASSAVGQSQSGTDIVRTRLRSARKFLSHGNGVTHECVIAVGMSTLLNVRGFPKGADAIAWSCHTESSRAARNRCWMETDAWVLTFCTAKRLQSGPEGLITAAKFRSAA